MPAVIEGVDRRTVLSTIVLDVLVTEEIELPGKVTRYPVEDGTEISDNITVEAETVRLSGNVAIADAAAIESGAGDEAGSKMVDVVEALRKLRKDRALVTCSTGQMRYADYAFESLKARRASSDGGAWLQIEANLVKVTKVELQTALVPEKAKAPAKGRTGQTNQNAGRTGNSNANNLSGTEARRQTFFTAGSDKIREGAGAADRYFRGLGRAAGVSVPQ